ncbi:hypothetical protein SPISAL_06265 [Spiribacter salinus M19-40]|jgi:hypothetical protein|uniref:Uncharacterized protein n=2 Tax=Spiribacter salinus TaxID=1335746 RepID=R4VLM1_9GAMM|nr:hypothetical protein [Spiribacter salinus]MDR9413078.1 hypothetical protein [Spiribacter sp.]AGM41347.1 hypothetical protein SPISAL_06265 [Spiribacter salinus M19-40]MBY5268937.1 hypothetical protein [Spiribacter salinus]MDR9454817.1 hypothetical protein [Spiribacter sp.]TQF00702.1 MAG: hypothetical protein FKY71_01935 [Spiribacter salinus]
MSDDHRRGTVTLALLGLVILLAYIVPYGFLQNIESWYGAFLFWTLFGVVAIGLIFRLVWSWRS